MLKNLRRRFIFFNMAIISVVILVLALFIFLGSKNELSIQRFIIVICVSLFSVFLASFIISKFALTPIQKAWQKQLDFTADASHELRTPLAVIKTNLSIVLDAKNETIAENIQWLENIESEQIRMTKLVEDLLLLSRADTNEYSINKEHVALSEIVNTTINGFTPLALNKNIILKTDIKQNISFSGDKSQLEQLIVILLDNAIHYTDKGEVFISLNQTVNKIELKVIDTGIGIKSADLERIFERFYRVTNSRSKNPDGSGLGLAIAKLIVELHQGEINVASKHNQGTSFIVTLPL